MKHWEGETPSFEVPIFKIYEIGNYLYIYLAIASDLGGNNIPAHHQETHHKMHCVSSRLPLYTFSALVTFLSLNYLYIRISFPFTFIFSIPFSFSQFTHPLFALRLCVGLSV
jgi:hypothetical protein